jgi:hypothetical protein
MQFGRRIYYEKATGNIIQDTGERSGDVIETTVEQDFATYAALAERVPETVDHIQLAHGQYAQDFGEGRLERINLETLEPVFSYPDPEHPGGTVTPPKPLTVQVDDLKARLGDVELALADAFKGGD